MKQCVNQWARSHQQQQKEIEDILLKSKSRVLEDRIVKREVNLWSELNLLVTGANVFLRAVVYTGIFSYIWIILHIHPSIIYTAYHFTGRRRLEPIPLHHFATLQSQKVLYSLRENKCLIFVEQFINKKCFFIREKHFAPNLLNITNCHSNLFALITMRN